MHGSKGVGGVNENSLVTLQSAIAVQGAPASGDLTATLGYTTQDYDWMVGYFMSIADFPGSDFQANPGLDPMSGQYGLVQYQTPHHAEGYLKSPINGDYTSINYKNSSGEYSQLITGVFQRTEWSGFLNTPTATFNTASTSNGTIPSLTGLTRTTGNHTLFVSVMCVYGSQWDGTIVPSGYTNLGQLEQQDDTTAYMTMVANYKWIEAGLGSDDNGTETATGYTAGTVSGTTQFIHLLHKYTSTPV